MRLQPRLRHQRARDEDAHCCVAALACEEPQVDEVLHLDEHCGPRPGKGFYYRCHDFPAPSAAAVIGAGRKRAMIRKAISALTFISRSPGDWTLPACGPERYQLRSVSTAIALLNPGCASSVRKTATYHLYGCSWLHDAIKSLRS